MAESRRVRMTKTLIKTAMMELMETLPIEKITVTDVCKTADVNRSTFYAYYEDTRQLLSEIENDVLDHLPVLSDSPRILSEETLLETLKVFFSYVKKNERLFRILIVHRDNNSFNQRLVAAITNIFKAVQQSKNELRERYTYIFCVSGVLGAMREWINNNFPLSPEDFAKMVLCMTSNAIS